MEMYKMSFEKLPIVKFKNGYKYCLVKRNEKVAIYEQLVERDINGVPGSIVGYEVFQVVVGKAFTLVQKYGKKKGEKYFYPAAEKFPGNEDFGKTAWSYCTLAMAEKKFESLK